MEIKYRAWDKPGKKMYTDFSFIQFNPNGLECEKWVMVKIVDGLHFIETDKCNGILMQYTGLKDKNGKEIYEGDIVIWETCNCEVRFGFHTIGDIQAYGFYLYFYNMKCDDPIDRNTSEYCEVIGNIYETPALVK